MVITLSGQNGLNAVRLVMEETKQEQDSAQIPVHNTVARTVKSLDRLMSPKNAILTRAVSLSTRAKRGTSTVFCQIVKSQSDN